MPVAAVDRQTARRGQTYSGWAADIEQVGGRQTRERVGGRQTSGEGQTDSGWGADRQRVGDRQTIN
jgi:hypothetical protein